MDKLKIGDRCFFDPLNTMGLKIGSTITVKIIQIDKKLLGRDVYHCIAMETNSIIKCNRNLLIKIEAIDDVNVPVIVRFPNTIPEITDTDMRFMSTLHSLIPETEEELLKAYKQLFIKLDYYNSINEV